MTDLARRFAERMLAELETDMGVHRETFIPMSRIRLRELRNALQGLLEAKAMPGEIDSKATKELLANHGAPSEAGMSVLELALLRRVRELEQR